MIPKDPVAAKVHCINDTAPKEFFSERFSSTHITRVTIGMNGQGA